jgi:glutathione synthase/RimK-type ligase-like ATP-grasp enzyme
MNLISFPDLGFCLWKILIFISILRREKSIERRKVTLNSIYFLENSSESKIDTHKPLFIVKPTRQAWGRGIFLTSKVEDIPSKKSWVVQEYITNPFLIDGIKFDLRIYVLVTHAEPLTIYIYKEGFARFASEKYDLSCFDANDK